MLQENFFNEFLISCGRWYLLGWPLLLNLFHLYDNNFKSIVSKLVQIILFLVYEIFSFILKLVNIKYIYKIPYHKKSMIIYMLKCYSTKIILYLHRCKLNLDINSTQLYSKGKHWLWQLPIWLQCNQCVCTVWLTLCVRNYFTHTSWS